MSEEYNCLRCARCALLPETDFSKRSAVIYCHAKNELTHEVTGTRVLNLGGCPQACPSRRNHGNVQMTPVSIAFLRHWWPKAQTEQAKLKISRLMGRTLVSTKRLAQVHGARCPRSLEQRREIAAKVRSKDARIFTAEQVEYLTIQYASGNWPLNSRNAVGLDWKKVQQQNAQIKEKLLREVELRGAPRTWDALVAWAYRQSPAYRRNPRHARKSATTC